jgi:hypothetical protein
MKEAIKGYHLFLPKSWMKWCLYIVYPLVIIGADYLMCRVSIFFAVLCVGLSGCGIVGVEYMLDAFVFGGIASKETNRLEYLKTSVRGIPLLRKALITDGVRRFCSVSLIVVVGFAAVTLSLREMQDFYGIYVTEEVTEMETEAADILPLQIVAYILVIYCIVELGLIILRFFINIYVSLLGSYIGVILAMTAGLTYSMWSVKLWHLLLLAVLGFGIAWLGRKIIMKKARDSYYDESMEKES